MLNNGTGWTNDTGIDSDSHIPGGSAQSTPTVLNSVPSDFIRESATFYPNTILKIRKAPTESGVDTGLIYAQVCLYAVMATLNAKDSFGLVLQQANVVG